MHGWLLPLLTSSPDVVRGMLALPLAFLGVYLGISGLPGLEPRKAVQDIGLDCFPHFMEVKAHKEKKKKRNKKK